MTALPGGQEHWWGAGLREAEALHQVEGAAAVKGRGMVFQLKVGVEPIGHSVSLNVAGRGWGVGRGRKKDDSPVWSFNTGRIEARGAISLRWENWRRGRLEGVSEAQVEGGGSQVQEAEVVLDWSQCLHSRCNSSHEMSWWC